MGVRYHQVVSQDLLSLKTLSSAHDTEPATETANQLTSVVKQPLRVDLKRDRPEQNSLGLELPMSPIANPSVLELLDTSTASESLYTEQPRVSTMKKSYLPPAHSTSSASALAFKHQDLPSRYPLGLDSMRDLSSFPKTLYAASKPLNKPATANKESHLFSTYTNQTAKTMNKPVTKLHTQYRNTSLDTERPILSSLTKSPRLDGDRPSHYSWGSMDWYGDKLSMQPPPVKKRNSVAGTATLSSDFEDSFRLVQRFVSSIESLWEGGQVSHGV